MKDKAPIIIFGFNRAKSLRRAVESLLQNAEARESDLFVFVDGARADKAGEAEKVDAVRKYAERIKGFKSLTCTFAERNKGLAPSVISGVTQVMNQRGRAIVVEDDLVVSKSLLRYMNEMLDKYESDARIMQVTGFGCKIRKPRDYSWDVYLNERAHSWSWGTWKDRWDTVDWEVSDFAELKGSRKKQIAFNKRGSDLYSMLRDYMEGRNSSWWIRFNYSMFKQHRFAVSPVRSLAQNFGFSKEATHCKTHTYNRYKNDFEEYHAGAFLSPERLEPSERIMHEAVKYWTIRYRIYGKIMAYLHKARQRTFGKISEDS